MSFVGLLLIAVGVSADAFAVALTMGVKMRRFAWRYVLTIALVFGGFQALMPFLGWLIGDNFLQYISAIDHWVAFALLAIVGAHMLKEAFEDDDDCETCPDVCACDSAAEVNVGQEGSPLSGQQDGDVLTVAKAQSPAYPKIAFGSLILLGIAESIDALAVGITFPVAGVNVWSAIALIGVVTTLLSGIAVWIGHKLGARFSKPAEIIGGLILIGIGVSVLIEHMA